MEKLYKLDSKGAVREWQVFVRGNTYEVVYGSSGGKMSSKITVCTPKNVGRSNATTAEEQAGEEALSEWNYQVDRKGYATLENLGKGDKTLRPMLALDATKVPHRIDWGQAVGSAKLDGLRTILRPDVNRLQSRTGTFYDAPKHILEKLKGINLPLDGELYLHGTPLNEILGASRKWNAELTDRLEFHAFDIAIPGMVFTERYSLLQGYKEKFPAAFELVHCYPLDKDSYKKAHDMHVKEGYEGLIIRHMHSDYDFGKRSPNLFKYKEFLDSEFEITGVEEDKDGGAVLVLVTAQGHEFRSRPRGTMAFRESLMSGDSVGSMATVRYFAMTSTDKPVPQFPVTIAIGDHK